MSTVLPTTIKNWTQVLAGSAAQVLSQDTVITELTERTFEASEENVAQVHEEMKSLKERIIQLESENKELKALHKEEIKLLYEQNMPKTGKWGLDRVTLCGHCKKLIRKREEIRLRALPCYIATLEWEKKLAGEKK